MSLDNFFRLIFILVIFAGYIWFKWMTSPERAQQKAIEKVNAMNPEARGDFLFGPVNDKLICPHCQTKGNVHVRQVSKTLTSTGKVGGILKTDTNTSTTTRATQHHCDQCNSTWDI